MTGYNIYYGTMSGDYTNEVSVEDATNATISGLEPGVTYYFVATSVDQYGNESGYSNEAALADYQAPATGNISWSVMPPALTNDQVSFSLADGAPEAVSLNSATGALWWDSNLAAAGSTNVITVIITDLSNPAASTQETLIITVPGGIGLAATSVPVQTGQSASLPLTSISSVGITNLVFTVNWPGNELVNPTLSFNAPIAGGVLINEGTNLWIDVWTANGDMLTGTNQFAEINFQAAAGQASAFFELSMTNVTANAADGSILGNAGPDTGEVVVIGTNPLLRSQYSADEGRSLTLYANPGANYEIQYATDLTAPTAWQTLEDYQPTNMVETVDLDSANPVVFYRLMQN